MDTIYEYSQNDIYLKHEITASPYDSSFPIHVHPTHEIYLFIKGRVTYLIEGSNYELSQGSILIIRPSESHKVKILEQSDYERFNLNFPTSFLRDADPEERLLEPFFNRPLGQYNLYEASELNGLDAEKLFHEMCYSPKNAYESRLRILTNLLPLLHELRTTFYSQNRSVPIPRSRQEQIVAYVNERLNGELNLPAIAEHFYLSTSQLNRLFRDATGVSPWEYIMIKRLSYARELLRNGTSVLETVTKVGYKDYSSFYRAYIKYFGSSPSAEKKHVD